MSKVKIKLNVGEIRKLLQSHELLEPCVEVANRWQQQAGDGYETFTFVGHDRVHAGIMAVTPEAKKDNYENNTLLKIKGGG